MKLMLDTKIQKFMMWLKKPATPQNLTDETKRQRSTSTAMVAFHFKHYILTLSLCLKLN